MQKIHKLLVISWIHPCGSEQYTPPKASLNTKIMQFTPLAAAQAQKCSAHLRRRAKHKGHAVHTSSDQFKHKGHALNTVGDHFRHKGHAVHSSTDQPKQKDHSAHTSGDQLEHTRVPAAHSV
jgi:hypothetical protein